MAGSVQQGREVAGQPLTLTHHRRAGTGRPRRRLVPDRIGAEQQEEVVVRPWQAVPHQKRWEKRGRTSDNTFEVLGCHHTAIVTDSDRLLVDGSSKVPGPLCNVALHANGDVVLVASGLANHFGCATWPNGRSLGVEATGPKFPNYDAYVLLAAGFCIFKGNADPRQVVVKRDAGIPVRLVAAHKEVAVGVPDADGKLGRDQCEATRKIYGRKVDPTSKPRPTLQGRPGPRGSPSGAAGCGTSTGSATRSTPA